jgi:hypothetical protein
MSSGELWFVKLPNGDVHHVTLDQLDAAFQGGHINENTPVLADGATTWTTLGQAAGLEDEAPPARAAAPSPTPAPVVRSVAPPVAHPSYVPQAAPTSYAPRSAPVSYAPRSAPVSYAPVANSIRPVAMDLGPSPYADAAAFKKSSRKGWVVAVMALSAVGAGVGFAATNGKIALGDSPLVAAAPPPAAAAPPPAVDPIPAANPTPAPQPPPPTTPQAPLAGALPAMDSPLNPHFAVAGKEPPADKTHQDSARAHHTYAAQTSSKKSAVFTKGGNKFDPLNSDL